MQITAIEITNVKGIAYQKFDLRLIPYKPNLLVAPNGFGKSSIATAFASMNSKRIVLDEKDCHQCDSANLPKLTITIDNKQQLTASASQNDIRQHFDVTVIRSGLVPKASRTYMGGTSASMEIHPIQICKIPPKATFGYQASTAKSIFGANGKILPNINNLLQNTAFCNAVASCDLSKSKGKRLQKSISNVIDTINQESGSADDIRQWVSNNLLDELRAIPHLKDLAAALEKLNLASSETEAFLAAYQILELYKVDGKGFGIALEWLNYSAIKQYYTDLLQSFCSSNWQWAKLQEDKKAKTLSVIFPQAHQLSNGQRDIVTLVLHMHKALYEGSKKPLILIIDEVFDYLDDANLVAFQYYVTSLIDEYRRSDQAVYPIILTHLDPGVFFDFCFNKHKIQTHYLQAQSSGKSGNTLKLIEAREDDGSVKDKLEKHWFHYYPDACEIDATEWPKRLPADWRKSEEFHTYTATELNRYLEGKKFDALAVCFAVRVTIEQKTYDLLGNSHDKVSFLSEHRTRKKLRYAAERLEDIPEIYFLLGLIYNTNLHWKQGRDYVSPLATKLNHPIIKRLIVAVVEGASHV